MTAGKAIETADALRPNNSFDRELKILWLRQSDAALRRAVVSRSNTTDFDDVGADVLYDPEQELLRPGQWIMCLGFGAGLTWGGAMFRW